jgi:DNA polymerase/3'-5' exonuclease PolX
MASIPENTRLWKHFSEIADAYRKDPDQRWRARTYTNDADHIKSFPEVITSSQQLANIRGIGPKSLHDIDEFLRTGTTARHQELYQNLSPIDVNKISVIELFKTVYGIGPENAEYFYQSGYRDLDTLYNSGLLNDKQKIGIQYRNDLLLRIPRDEITYLGSMINQKFPNSTVVNGITEPVWYIAGSYRREEPDSGDVDILVRYVNMEYFINILKSMNIIVAILAYKETKFMGIIKVLPHLPARRLDVRVVRSEEFIYALLYFTGSQKLNILMRNRANQLGASLNEYNLYDYQGKTHPVESEQNIFALLGIVYIEPKYRTKDISNLQFTTPLIAVGPPKRK